MRKRTLGRSGIEVSEVALGSWLTFAGGIAREKTEACTRTAFDLGITFFDTANVYGQGTAESAWGEILSGYPRGDYVLATKVWGKMPDGRGLAPDQVAQQLDRSLERLRTDYVDVYYLHRFDKAVPVADTLGALTRLVEAGKVRTIGFSEWTPEQVEAALAVPEVARFSVSQPQYSMLWRAPETEVFPLCERHGIAQAVWSPLGEGVLSGKYRPGEAPPPDSRAASASMSNFIGKFTDDGTLEAVQALRPIADGLGLSMAQLAVAWVLRRPEVAAAIVGASRPEQLREIVGGSGIALTDEVCASIDAALGEHVQRDPALAVFAEAGLGASAGPRS